MRLNSLRFMTFHLGETLDRKKAVKKIAKFNLRGYGFQDSGEKQYELARAARAVGGAGGM